VNGYPRFGWVDILRFQQPHIEIKWENINYLFNVDKSYHISAKIGDAIQMTIKICLDKPDNTDSFLSHLTNWNRNNNVQADENNK